MGLSIRPHQRTPPNRTPPKGRPRPVIEGYVEDTRRGSFGSSRWFQSGQTINRDYRPLSGIAEANVSVLRNRLDGDLAAMTGRRRARTPLNAIASLHLLMQRGNECRVEISPQISCGQALVGERIRAQLNVIDARLFVLAAFAVEVSPGAGGRPHAATLPAGLRIVDPAVGVLGEEAERVGQADVDELAIDQSQQ